MSDHDHTPIGQMPCGCPLTNPPKHSITCKLQHRTDLDRSAALIEEQREEIGRLRAELAAMKQKCSEANICYFDDYERERERAEKLEAEKQADLDFIMMATDECTSCRAEKAEAELAEARERIADLENCYGAAVTSCVELGEQLASWKSALDELHIENWVGVIDGLSPREAVRKLLNMALDQEKDELRDALAALRKRVEEAPEITARIVPLNDESGKAIGFYTTFSHDGCMTGNCLSLRPDQPVKVRLVVVEE